MRAPSLYVYAESKNALFDLMFADGYRQLADRIEAADRPDDPRALLRDGGPALRHVCGRAASALPAAVPVHGPRFRAIAGIDGVGRPGVG